MWAGCGYRLFFLEVSCYCFSRFMVKLCGELEHRCRSAQVIARQLIRSGTSVAANVEEGQASQSEADFLTKYSIACKEARESCRGLD